MKSIYDDTPIIPEIVADRIVGELALYWGRKGIRWEPAAELSDKLAAKAERVYAHRFDSQWSRRIRGANGLEYLCMFMRHWLSAEFYRTPLQSQLPPEFCIGRPATA